MVELAAILASSGFQRILTSTAAGRAPSEEEWAAASLQVLQAALVGQDQTLKAIERVEEKGDPVLFEQHLRAGRHDQVASATIAPISRWWVEGSDLIRSSIEPVMVVPCSRSHDDFQRHSCRSQTAYTFAGDPCTAVARLRIASSAMSGWESIGTWLLSTS
jgi:hypothetical protein